MKSRVTIKDIAQKTGFSVTTISLVLNDKANHIPRETKLIIAKAVKEMGYRPNKMAVGLVKKQSNIIGFVLPDIRNQFFSYTAKVLEDECHKYDWNLLICNSDNNHKPYCLIDRDMFDIGKYKISVDHLQGAYLATEHLIKLGHKKIGCITGPLILDDARQRLAGYKQALKDNGIKIDENLIFEGDYSFEKGKIGCDDLLAKNITAIFAANDFSAMGALASIKEHNLIVPRDISIVGYDDIAFASLLEVPLTTVRQPIDAIGQKATAVINHLVNSEENIDSKIIILEPKLIVRSSTKTIS